MSIDELPSAATATHRKLRAFRLHDLHHPLLDRLEPPSVFQSRPFLSAVDDALCSNNRNELILIGVEDETGRAVGLFPFIRRRSLGAILIEGLDLHVTDYFAPAVADNIPAAQLWKAVMDALPPADAITFKKLPITLYGRSHGLTDAPFLEAMGAAAYTAQLRDPDGRAVSAADLPVARDVRRKLRKLESMGDVTFDEATSRDDIVSAIERLVEFRTTRFRGMRRRDILAREEYRAFYRLLASGPDTIGRLFSLKVDGEAVAVIFALVSDGTVTLVIPSISSDDRWHVASPGLIALYMLYDWAVARGFSTFDFSVGSAGYKARFNTQRIDLFEYQRALTPLGLPIVANATLRRLLRRSPTDHPLIYAALRRIVAFKCFCISSAESLEFLIPLAI